MLEGGMTLQPTPLSSPGSPAAPVTKARGPRLPPGMRVGAVLVCVGVAFTGVLAAWGYLAVRAVASPRDLVGVYQTQDALQATQNLLLSVGFYLLFQGAVRVLPRGGLWTRLAPLLILIGGASFAIGDVALFAMAPVLYAPLSGQPIDFASVTALLSAVTVTGWVGSVAGVAGTVLSLVAVAQGALRHQGSIPPTIPG